MGNISEPLTDKQVGNLRAVLFAMIGPYALLMPREDIQQWHDRLQAQVDEVAKPCQCDPAKNGTTTHADGRVTCNKCGRER